MPNKVNQLLLRDYVALYKDVAYALAIGYEGMDVAHTNELRTLLASKKMKLKFVKNRLASLAFEQIGVKGVGSILSGQVAFVIGEDPVAMARTVKEFAKENKQVKVRGAIVEKTVVDAKAAMGLADGASKEELKARIASAAMAPGRNLAGAINAPGANVAGAIKALAEKLEKAEPQAATA